MSDAQTDNPTEWIYSTSDKEVQYTDKELLDWLNDGDDGNIRDNLEAVDYQICHRNKWDIREAIAACLKHSKENKI